MQFSLNKLKRMKTLAKSQADNLKYDKDGVRVWFCRCGVADGMPYDNQVTVENLVNGRWEVVSKYQAQ